MLCVENQLWYGLATSCDASDQACLGDQLDILEQVAHGAIPKADLLKKWSLSLSQSPLSLHLCAFFRVFGLLWVCCMIFSATCTTLSTLLPSKVSLPLSVKFVLLDKHAHEQASTTLSLWENRQNSVLRVLFRKRELTEFCSKLPEFCKKLSEFTSASK